MVGTNGNTHLRNRGFGSMVRFERVHSRSSPFLPLVIDGGKSTKKNPLLWESALSGASAGAISNLVLFLADTVKSTMQIEEEPRPRTNGAPRPRFFGMLGRLCAKQGPKGLHAGCGITIVRSVPSSALIFLIYDGLAAPIFGIHHTRLSETLDVHSSCITSYTSFVFSRYDRIKLHGRKIPNPLGEHTAINSDLTIG